MRTPSGPEARTSTREAITVLRYGLVAHVAGQAQLRRTFVAYGGHALRGLYTLDLRMAGLGVLALAAHRLAVLLVAAPVVTLTGRTTVPRLASTTLFG